ncbi:MAG TPA: hypothetical protein VGP08_03100 [Pyrinomonadaceae bacterium]|nr:hypothetical protein [Pyrinomonadaceae bacterium]
MTESGDGPEDDTVKNRRSVRAFLIAAAQAAVLIPLLFYLHDGEINAFALSFTGFIVVLCLLVALGYSIPDRPDRQTQSDAKVGPVGRVGSFWLVACAFGPFFGWLVTEGFTLTEENWRWRYAARLLLCVGLPVVCALPLLRYVRGKYWHVALLLLSCVTALAAWSGLNTLRDLREGPTVRRTTGFYDAPHNSFYPSAEGRPFKLTTLAHTGRNLRIEPAPPGE